jgi:hypothetical protein
MQAHLLWCVAAALVVGPFVRRRHRAGKGASPPLVALTRVRLGEKKIIIQLGCSFRLPLLGEKTQTKLFKPLWSTSEHEAGLANTFGFPDGTRGGLHQGATQAHKHCVSVWA